jgi:integrase
VLSFEEERGLLAACTGKREHLKPLLICALDTAMRHGEILKMRWQDVNFTTEEIYIPQTNTSEATLTRS